MLSSDPNDTARKAEIDRLLSMANVHRLRGQYAEAEDTYRQALALDESRADIQELIGDTLDWRDQLDKAAEEYKKALDLDPKRVSSETKYARMIFRIGEREHEKRLAQEMIENPHEYAPPRRHPLLAFILSGLVPGIGQVYNGELQKGIILIGAFLFSTLVLALSPTETKNLLIVFGSFVNPLAATGKTPPVSGLVMFFAGVSMFVYIYAVIDAPITAAKRKEPEVVRPSGEAMRDEG